ncbi:MAG: hypothetical protein OXG82_20440 [Gammaproteobacteria bacterium]|nr:hypothetical protein [Gammaproteobacteria bacterium]
MLRDFRRLARLAAVGFAAAAAMGCQSGASVTVDISVPRPLVQPLDVDMGVYFDDTLKNYVHEEELEEYGDYRIDIGASQVPVFAQVFDAMFDRVIPVIQEPAVEDPTTPAASAAVSFRPVDGPRVAVDGILAPSIDEVQFAIPDQTGGEFYEVWIRYNLKLLGADGALLGEWPVIGYGKANQRNYGAIDQKEVALNEATIWALRDAAAWLSFQFPDQAEVQTWLTTLDDMP